MPEGGRQNYRVGIYTLALDDGTVAASIELVDRR
jgi:hypothetical protein